MKAARHITQALLEMVGEEQAVVSTHQLAIVKQQHARPVDHLVLGGERLRRGLGTIDIDQARLGISIQAHHRILLELGLNILPAQQAIVEFIAIVAAAVFHDHGQRSGNGRQVVRLGVQWKVAQCVA